MQTLTNEMRETIARDSAALANAKALASIMQEHGITIPAKDFPTWRATVRNHGTIPGVALNVTIIATNGVLGLFVYDDPTVPVLYGHIQCFSGDVKTLFSSAAAKPMKALGAKTSKPRVSKLDRALALLIEMKKGQK